MKNCTFLTTMLAALATIVLTSANLQAESIYGIVSSFGTPQQLVSFNSTTGAVTNNVSLPSFITSIFGETVVSIDVRPATGELYGLSSQNKLYKLNPTTGASTLVGSGLGVTLSGIATIDFNPTVDRVRIVTNNGQNFRAHPDTGAIVFTDMPLMFKTGDANEGDMPSVINAAYTNSFAGATTTTLYGIEAGNDVLVTQAPPNDGKLNTVGQIGFDLGTNGLNGFDISGTSGRAYLVGNSTFMGDPFGTYSLYTANLVTGVATQGPTISPIGGTLVDIAVSPAVPEPATGLLAVLATLTGLAIRRR